MGNKFRLVKERIKTVALVGRTWRLVSMVRQRIIAGREIRQRMRAEREAKRKAEREINARFIKIV